MNGQYFGENFRTLDQVVNKDDEMNPPQETQDFESNEADSAPQNDVDAEMFIGDNIQEETALETVAADEPKIPEAGMDETLEHPISASQPAPVSSPPVAALPAAAATLLEASEAEHLRTRWSEIQGKFVDDPRSSVQSADELVTEVIGKITKMFDDEHAGLENQWKQGNDVSTEDLRKALQKYRSFFNRLVV